MEANTPYLDESFLIGQFFITLVINIHLLFIYTAVLGCAVAYALIPVNARGNLGMVSLNPDVSVAQGFVVETIFTILLILVIFASVSPDHERKDVGFVRALAIGLCVTVCMTIAVCLSIIVCDVFILQFYNLYDYQGMCIKYNLCGNLSW